jgi:hypothetical protein
MGVDSATTEVFGPEIKIKTFLRRSLGQMRITMEQCTLKNVNKGWSGRG